MDGKRKLFISFSGLVWMMKEGKVAPDDLKGALFYFGCGRDYLGKDFIGNPDIRRAFELGKDGEDLEGAVTTYNRIRIAAFVAEDESRAYLRDKDQLSFQDLSQLLEINGIDTSSVGYLEGERYCHPTVKKNYDGLVEVMVR